MSSKELIDNLNFKTMKLYTEEQVRKAYNDGCWNGFNNIKDKENFHINELTPIELPSDEEIDEIIEKRNYFLEYGTVFFYGAKWVIDNIKKQQQ